MPSLNTMHTLSHYVYIYGACLLVYKTHFGSLDMSPLTPIPSPVKWGKYPWKSFPSITGEISALCKENTNAN